ncbi:MAG TPA: hydroxyethylthiazole kinase [Candidatus Corynebacterium avicola]|uniref:ADP-dependent (S)-NAD(P)H-hydrate dehydratase n=1 Tax=Candidatus Corynebacterium avicola TaxID=2838527 RepID=A0A9D1RQX7_9CORY|nr:hydroxyethylthiazole kinase [Candidatus Corynebacterium avicola]
MTQHNENTLGEHQRSLVFTAEEIRAAEAPLLEAQTREDEVMQSAARAVAAAARVMLTSEPMGSFAERILLAVGAGGNGGDALYAGALLRDEGWEVDAVLFGRDRDTGDVRAHELALEAFIRAGGSVVELDEVWPRPPKYRLIIDGVLGLGGAGGLDPVAATLFAFAGAWFVPVLAVDVPSGIAADTGATPEPVDVDNPLDPEAGKRFPEGERVLANDRAPGHVIADMTVTFGGLRRAHAVNAYCGQVVLADPGLDDGGTIGGNLWKLQWKTPIEVTASIAAPKRPQGDGERRAGTLDMSGPWDLGSSGLVPMAASHIDFAWEPGPYDDKYSQGVVGVCAGSETYPGAAVLATTGAVRTTSAMVRYIGAGASEVLRATPEVVWAPDLASCGRVQAWVVGPGRGTGEEATAELAELLGREEALLIDADAITVLSEHPELLDSLAAREASTLLTPHAGEFRRLAATVVEARGVDIPDPDADRIGAATAMARTLRCSVLIKGRHTVVVDRPHMTQDGREWRLSVRCIDAGTSWGATPGSGDVLSGLAGALMAQSVARLGNADHGAYQAVALHALAASVGARQAAGGGEGPGVPVSASQIAEAIPRAWALSGRSHPDRQYLRFPWR